MAARLAVAARRSDQRFIFMAPPSCEFLGCVIAAGLLLADFVHKIAPGNVPEGEGGPLLDGDLLVVTHSVGETVERLRSLKLGDDTLQEYWFVDSYSSISIRSAKARFSLQTRVGPDGITESTHSGMVIDATHPAHYRRFTICWRRCPTSSSKSLYPPLFLKMNCRIWDIRGKQSCGSGIPKPRRKSTKSFLREQLLPYRTLRNDPYGCAKILT